MAHHHLSGEVLVRTYLPIFLRSYATDKLSSAMIKSRHVFLTCIPLSQACVSGLSALESNASQPRRSDAALVPVDLSLCVGSSLAILLILHCAKPVYPTIIICETLHRFPPVFDWRMTLMGTVCFEAQQFGDAG